MAAIDIENATKPINRFMLSIASFWLLLRLIRVERAAVVLRGLAGVRAVRLA
jgi:hypothetical protein